MVQASFRESSSNRMSPLPDFRHIVCTEKALHGVEIAANQPAFHNAGMNAAPAVGATLLGTVLGAPVEKLVGPV